jgi:hypothetical protein
MKNKNIITTAAGTLIYPWLNTADTKFVADGVYHTKFKLDAADALSLVAELQKLRDAYANELQKKTNKKPKLAALPFEFADDDSYVVFKAKLNASGINRTTNEEFTQKPALMGPDGQNTTEIVTNGSTARIAIEPVLSHNAALGVILTLRLKAVKVLEFAPRVSASSSVFEDDPSYAPAKPKENVGLPTAGEADYDF